MITTNNRQQTSRQAVQYLLCSDCEGRFDRGGENWVLKHCYRGKGRFRLRTLLEESPPLYAKLDFTICSASRPDVSIDQLAYFAVSVFWRASVVDWWSSQQKYESIELGVKYQEEVRKFLLGETGLSQNFAVTVILSRLTRPVLAFNFPHSSRFNGVHSHRLHIPGMTFLLDVGKEVPNTCAERCILRSSLHPIFISTDGDKRVQNEIMAMMGKVAPAWADYLLTEGVENW
jgi:hypothetical protein